MDCELILHQVRYFLEHTSGQISAIELLEIDVKVRRNEPLLFLEFLFQSLFSGFVVTAETLSKTLLKFGALTDLIQDLIALLEETQPKSSKTTLHKSSVVVNLETNRLLWDNLPDSRLHKQILGSHKPIMKSMVVGLEKDSLDLEFG